MNNQKINLRYLINFDNISSVISLYFYSLGTVMLGFSLYLFYSINIPSDQFSWIGDTLFWAFIILFSSIFLLFIPVEFLNKTTIRNVTFNDLVVNISTTILTSLIFLIIFQIFINYDSKIINEVKYITRSISFSGFIVMPLVYFVHNNLSKRFILLEKLSFSFFLGSWIISAQFFL